jgi:hypothetical protein
MLESSSTISPKSRPGEMRAPRSRRGILLRRLAIQQRQHEPEWRTPSVIYSISITPLLLPLRNYFHYPSYHQAQAASPVRLQSHGTTSDHSAAKQLHLRNSAHTHENSHIVITTHQALCGFIRLFARTWSLGIESTCRKPDDSAVTLRQLIFYHDETRGQVPLGTVGQS